MKQPKHLTLLFLLIISLLFAACAPAPVAEETDEPAATDETVATEEVEATETEAPDEATATEEATGTEEATAVPSPTIPAPVVTTGEDCAEGSTPITWYIGLGAGSNADVIPAEQDWAAKYNEAH